MSLIFLVGMPGVGKSYWGRRWARAFGAAFLDLDRQIEYQQGESVAQIFETRGEPIFRELESEALLQLIRNSGSETTIVSCGGGTPMFHDNMENMLRTGYVVWLKADLEFLLQQISASRKIRPLLREKDPKQALEALLHVREPVYQRADIHLDIETIDTDTFAEILKACTDRP